MSEITRETVEHYAKLANLSFEDHELDLFVNQFSNILHYVEQISALDLSDLEATAQVVPWKTNWREDLVQARFTQKEALANAPDSESGHFLVPKVIDSKG